MISTVLNTSRRVSFNNPICDIIKGLSGRRGGTDAGAKRANKGGGSVSSASLFVPISLPR
jgi:hypothetical protein